MEYVCCMSVVDLSSKQPDKMAKVDTSPISGIEIIKECLDPEQELVPSIFVVLGASVSTILKSLLSLATQSDYNILCLL